MRIQLRKLMQQLSSDQRVEYQSLYDSKEALIDRSTGLRRTTLHLSGDMSNDEVKKAVAEAYGCRPEDLPEINFSGRVSVIKEEKADIKTIIVDYEKYLNSNNSTRGKHDELVDVGRFILATKPSLRIVVPTQEQPYPDFLINDGGTTLALEHTRLIDESLIMVFKNVKQILQQAEELLKPGFEASSKNINVFFKYDEPVSTEGSLSAGKLSIEDKKNLSTAVSEYLKAVLIGNPGAKPVFIDKIQVSDNRELRLNIVLAEDYRTSHSFIELLLECMAKKEIKANNYRNVIDGNKLLLLVIVDDINSFSGFDLAATKLPKMSHSNFDKIYVFEKYGGKVYQLN